MLGEAAAIVGFVWMAAGLFNMLTAPLEMTVGDWRESSQKLQNGALCNAFALGITAVAMLTDGIVRQSGRVQLLCSAGIALSGVLCVVGRLAEAHTPYSRRPSTATVPKEATHIR